MKSWTAALIGAVAGASVTAAWFELGGGRRSAFATVGQKGAEGAEGGTLAEGGAEGGGRGRGGRAGVTGSGGDGQRQLDQMNPTVLLQQAQLLATERDELKAKLDATEAQLHVDKDRDIKPYAMTKDQLTLLAKRCQLSWDMPSLGGQAELNLADAKKLGFDDADRTNINKVLAENDTYVTSELRKIYTEVTGDSAGAGNLSAESMWKEIEDKSPMAVKQQSFKMLSSERAGFAPAPKPGAAASPTERMFRLITTDGDRVEKQLGTQVGSDFARKYRDLYNGFSGRYTSTYGCPKGESE